MTPRPLGLTPPSPSSSASTVATYDSSNSRPSSCLGTQTGPHRPATTTDAQTFAQLFPSLERLRVRHDDSAEDGERNLRVDVVVEEGRGGRGPLTLQLFHLRILDMQKRILSLRRYDTIKLEFSNYARISLRRRGGRRYGFDWWGERYRWKRASDAEAVGSFYLLRVGCRDPVAYLVAEGGRAGGLVPPCSLWIGDRAAAADFAE
ncbi:hypothetical protein GQ602_006369 [Ophiocordyceps camponoti-floridani]|uniref:Uncharacterized protein n=1 Tax=Ophiocordyceps camponoti-floridani TaxID=2030778 RepID=A0A8H4VBR6_9HYPO|nr:hypothetical protein GQ602_006369 [Ophiocordyceps camponoti-floridani]